MAPEEDGGYDGDGGEDPQIGCGECVTDDPVFGEARADRPSDQPLVDDLMEVSCVRHPGVGAQDKNPPVDCEQGLENRVEAEQEREPLRDLRVPRREEDRQLGNPETEEVGPPVAEEDQATGVVPKQETDQGSHQGQRRDHDRVVRELKGDVGDAGEDDESDHTAQAVIAVDDVKRVGDAGDRKAGDDDCEPWVGRHQGVDSEDLEAGQPCAEEPPGEGRR